MSIEDINTNEENISSGTVQMCDICRKPLEDCPEWRQIQKSFKDMEEGNYKRYDSAEEYLKELESNA